MRLIDADALERLLADFISDDRGGNLTVQEIANNEAIVDTMEVVHEQPTVEAVPVEFVMDQYNSEFVCDALNDDDDWCAEHCQFSEAQPMCIHRFIERAWIPEMERRAKMDEVSE